MLVTLTGGTGLVGAHTTAALVRAGHRVRLLVRDPTTVPTALCPLGVDLSAVDAEVGDATDETAASRAARGADAVLHAAAVYSFDRRRRAEMLRVNTRATEVVLAAARRAGAGRIVHVSSTAALFGPGVRVVDDRTPPGTSREPYAATKSASEAVARAHQRAGAPVVISRPPALLGPHDPKLGDQTRRLRDTVRGIMPVWPSGALQIGDVRDTAALHTALLEGTATGAHFGPGHLITTPEYVAAARRATGRTLPAVFLPGALVAPVGRLVDLLQPVWPWHIPAAHGAIATAAASVSVAPTASTLGLRPRPFAETVADTLDWLVTTGELHLDAA
ncbi:MULTISPECIES: NAD-dependent epimerase/dehydratase family protein [Actinosynnema]|uniref:NAD-dependent epimerase/dehydratase family protein n=1 Tax=Actinosynnema TaxID=40566 RepID=UPI0020A2E42E|nr:NAD-dependent epimerase/dehydratase family protein [Actinosynnema pretiosum]MCP2094945.1 Nucleoside-diphosphate-sugar epimerase [Actinosynnema pretiosum]